jgi:replication initiation and membrane attachment protein
MAKFWQDIGWCCRAHRPIQAADLYGLIHLYQPMIGATALALYLTLVYQLPLHRRGISEVFRHSYLSKLCALSFDQMLEARYLLEGVGLLNTYEKKDEEKGRYYEYEIIPSLSPEKFFQSDVLSLTLFNLLGKERYLAVKRQLIEEKVAKPTTVSSLSTNITKSFQEVFRSLSPADLAKAAALEIDADWKLNEPKEKLVDGQFPLWKEDDTIAMFRMRLSSLVQEEVWTEKLIADLQEVRFLYQLDEWDLLKALQNPYVTSNGQIDIDRLQAYVKGEYRLRFGGIPRIVKRPCAGIVAPLPPIPPAPTALQESLSEEERHFQQLAKISPLELLSHYQDGARIPDSDVDLVSSLSHHYGLSHGVINVLLEYVLLKYDYKLPKQLVEKIAGHWKRLKIETVPQALQQARKEDWEMKKKKTSTKAEGKTAKRTQSRPVKKLPRAVAEQMQMQSEPYKDEHPPLDGEDLATKQARIRAKLKLMDERLDAKKEEKEKTL